MSEVEAAIQEMFQAPHIQVSWRYESWFMSFNFFAPFFLLKWNLSNGCWWCQMMRVSISL